MTARVNSSAFLAILLVHTFLLQVKSCEENVIDELFTRANSYTGNEFVIPGPQLCRHSMILECEESGLSKLDLQNMTFAEVLPLVKFDFNNATAMAKEGDPIDGDPDVPPRTTVWVISRSGKNYSVLFEIDGVVTFARKGDSKQFSQKFHTKRKKDFLWMQVTCLDESMDKLENIYVELRNELWRTEFTDCPADQLTCEKVEQIVQTKIVHSFTVALIKLVQQLTTTGQVDT